MGSYEKRVRELIASGVKPRPGIDLGHPVMDLPYEPMDIYCVTPHKVRYTGHGGYGDELAPYRSILKTGEIYTVTAVTFGTWVAHAHLEEFPGMSFDAVVFEDAPGTRQHEAARLAEIGKTYNEMTAFKLDFAQVVDAVVGDLGREGRRADNREGAKDGKASKLAGGTEGGMIIRDPKPALWDENSIDPVHGGKRKGLSPIAARMAAFERDPIAIAVLADQGRTGLDAGIPVDRTFEAMIPLPDMAGETRPRVAGEVFGFSDKLITWGTRFLGIMTAILTAAVFLHLFGIIP